MINILDILVGSGTRLSWTWKALACSCPSARIWFWLFLGCIPELAAAPAGHWCLPGWPWCYTPPLMAALLALCTLPVGLWPLDLHWWAMWHSAGYCLLYFLGYRVSLHSLAWFTFTSCQPRLPAQSSSPCQNWLELFTLQTCLSPSVTKALSVPLGKGKISLGEKFIFF